MSAKKPAGTFRRFFVLLSSEAAVASAIIVSFYALPIILFTKKNIHSMPIPEASVLVAASLLLGVAVAAICFLLLRDWLKAAVLAAVLAFPLLQYLDLKEWITSALPVGDAVAACLLFLALPVGAFLLIKRLGSERARMLASYLAIVGPLIAAYSLVQISMSLANNSGTTVTVDNEDLRRATVDPPERKPDIYYLVFDRYEGPIGLRESFDFDNSEFLNELRSMGFYVADRSFSNYPTTRPSLASSLNGGTLEVHGSERIKSAKPLNPLFYEPAVASFLRDKLGYSFAEIGSWGPDTQTSRIADRNPRPAWQIDLFGEHHLPYYSGVFLVGTAPGSAYDRYGGTNFSQYQSHGDIFLDQLDAIRQQARHDEPTLVFSHLLMPHPPLVFDEQGNPSDPGLSNDERFLKQLQFTNKHILALVRDLIAQHRGEPPVIILAADEGEYEKLGEDQDLSDFSSGASNQALRKKTNILAAFRFPEGRHEDLYPAITPVNFFRVTFNEFFGTDLELQPDRTRTVRSSDMPLGWVDVTERVRQGLSD